MRGYRTTCITAFAFDSSISLPNGGASAELAPDSEGHHEAPAPAVDNLHTRDSRKKTAAFQPDIHGQLDNGVRAGLICWAGRPRAASCSDLF